MESANRFSALTADEKNAVRTENRRTGLTLTSRTKTDLIRSHKDALKRGDSRTALKIEYRLTDAELRWLSGKLAEGKYDEALVGISYPDKIF
jgi:hypothetical protein